MGYHYIDYQNLTDIESFNEIYEDPDSKCESVVQALDDYNIVALLNEILNAEK
jgi:hypothetical protein